MWIFSKRAVGPLIERKQHDQFVFFMDGFNALTSINGEPFGCIPLRQMDHLAGPKGSRSDSIYKVRRMTSAESPLSNTRHTDVNSWPVGCSRNETNGSLTPPWIVFIHHEPFKSIKFFNHSSVSPSCHHRSIAVPPDISDKKAHASSKSISRMSHPLDFLNYCLIKLASSLATRGMFVEIERRFWGKGRLTGLTMINLNLTIKALKNEKLSEEVSTEKEVHKMVVAAWENTKCKGEQAY